MNIAYGSLMSQQFDCWDIWAEAIMQVCFNEIYHSKFYRQCFTP
jgi:hypothetical protein